MCPHKLAFSQRNFGDARAVVLFLLRDRESRGISLRNWGFLVTPFRGAEDVSHQEAFIQVWLWGVVLMSVKSPQLTWFWWIIVVVVFAN